MRYGMTSRIDSNKPMALRSSNFSLTWWRFNKINSQSVNTSTNWKLYVMNWAITITFVPVKNAPTKGSSSNIVYIILLYVPQRFLLTYQGTYSSHGSVSPHQSTFTLISQEECQSDIGQQQIKENNIKDEVAFTTKMKIKIPLIVGTIGLIVHIVTSSVIRKKSAINYINIPEVLSSYLRAQGTKEHQLTK